MPVVLAVRLFFFSGGGSALTQPARTKTQLMRNPLRFRRLAFRVTLACIACLSVGCALAAESEAPFVKHTTPAPGVNPEPVLQLHVTLSDKVEVGRTDDGERFIVPITGGHFIGKGGIAGEVMPGGADWQVVRADGVKTITALYSIKTDDGQVIVVDNRGITWSEDDRVYKRTIPKFHAPAGKYEWLNKSLFVGTISSIKSPRAVVIRVYEVN